MNTPKVTSMAELAKLAGCSVMTVSYALRNSDQVSLQTRERINQLAAEYGYRTNPMVAALMNTRRSGKQQESETIALLTKFEQPIRTWKRRRSFYSDLYDGMVERVAELGFRLEEFHIPDSKNFNGKQLERILSTRGIRGVILMPSGNIDQPFPEIAPENFAIIAAAFHAQHMRIHRSAADYSMGMSICLEQAQKRGYRRIGLAMTRYLDPATRYYISGQFLAWQVQLPASRKIPLIPDDTDLASREVFLKWVEKHKPDCIISSRTAVKDWLLEVGYKLPEDIGCLFMPVRDDPYVSGYDTRIHTVGRASVNLIARELYMNHRGLPDAPEVILVGGQWQEGNTIRPLGA